MILISHRGNIDGNHSNNENDPKLIKHILDMGFDVEIDVWVQDGMISLGHDEPTYKIPISFLQNDRLWCHAKNLEALEFMVDCGIHCFWHQQDDFTLTNKGFIWTYPNKKVCKKSIIVCDTLKEAEYYFKKDIAGICSDYVEYLR